jgi:WD40 repeat protein
MIWLVVSAIVWSVPANGQEPEKRPSVWKDAVKGARWDGLALSPDKKYLVTNHNEYELRLWDVATGQPLITKDDAEYTKWFLFSKDSKLLFADCKSFGPAGTGGHTKILEVPSGKEVGRYQAGMLLAASPDGDHLLLMQNIDGKTCKVILWDWRKGKEVRSMVAAEPFVDQGVFSPDGKLAATTKSYVIEVWDVATGKRVNRIHCDDAPRDQSHWVAHFSTLAFSPDGKTLASGGRGAQLDVLLWELESGKAVAPAFVKPAGSVTTMFYTPDGRGLVWAGRNGMRVWNVKADKEVAKFGQAVRRMALSADGKLAAVRYEGSTDIHFYDIPDLPKDD